MARFSSVKVTFFVILYFLYSPFVQANDEARFYDLIRHLPGFSAALPMDLCKKTFVNNKIINQKVTVNNSINGFKLFAFTGQHFDPKKPSIVVIHGGPGGLWGPSDLKKISTVFNKFNVIFFHYRGGGCSAFPSNSQDWDKLLTSDGVVEDIEAIRRAYGISKWHGAIGYSYGTIIARRYANIHPERAGVVILEGLSELDGAEEAKAATKSFAKDDSAEKVMSIIRNRFQDSQLLSKYRDKINISDFLFLLSRHFLRVSPITHYTYAALSDRIINLYEAEYKKIGMALPKFISLETFLSVTFLFYSGESEDADYAILVLMDQFDVISLDDNLRRELKASFIKYDKKLFPYKYSDYIDIFKNNSLFSFRVNQMTGFDKSLSKSSICTSNPIIVISGSKDIVTPIDVAKNYLKDSSCTQGAKVGLTIIGGGHSNLNYMPCLYNYVNKALLTQRIPSGELESCKLPVKVESY